MQAKFVSVVRRVAYSRTEVLPRHYSMVYRSGREHFSLTAVSRFGFERLHPIRMARDRLTRNVEIDIFLFAHGISTAL